jgi:hypothetical protein
MNPTQNEGGGGEEGGGWMRGEDTKNWGMDRGGGGEERITEKNEKACILLLLFDDLTLHHHLANPSLSLCLRMSALFTAPSPILLLFLFYKTYVFHSLIFCIFFICFFLFHIICEGS